MKMRKLFPIFIFGSLVLLSFSCAGILEFNTTSKNSSSGTNKVPTPAVSPNPSDEEERPYSCDFVIHFKSGVTEKVKAGILKDFREVKAIDATSFNVKIKDRSTATETYERLKENSSIKKVDICYQFYHFE